MTPGRARLIAALFVLLIALLLSCVGYAILISPPERLGLLGTIEIKPQIVSIIVNVASGLIGAVILFFVYTYLFNLPETDHATSLSSTGSSSDLTVEATWRDPLFQAIKLLIEGRSLTDGRSLEVFKTIKLQDGTQLLSGDQIKGLHREIERVNHS